MAEKKVGFVHKKSGASANCQLFLRLQIYGFIGWKEQGRAGREITVFDRCLMAVGRIQNENGLQGGSTSITAGFLSCNNLSGKDSANGHRATNDQVKTPK